MMDSSLQLNHIRGVLIRLEETIIFGLIERAQFRQNRVIYQANGIGKELADRSLLDFLLHDCESSHARVRRYESPDEHPFFDGLPAPILPEIDYHQCPLHPNEVNINPRIKQIYETEIVPFICEAGDDEQHGSSAVMDVHILQSLSKRIHYGKFVAESKYRQNPEGYDVLISASDRDGLREAITDRPVEEALFERVGRKAAAYSRELAAAGERTVAPGSVVTIYERWIIPLSKDVEVDYLMARKKC